MENYKQLRSDLRTALEELYNAGSFEDDDVLVIGCSTSEVLGKHIGKGGSEELGIELCDEIFNFCNSKKLNPCFQCCEHLNRSLIISKKIAKQRNLTIVNVKPKLDAGGAMATAAYNKFTDPVAVQSIQAECGIDIGDTIIGMHLKPVVVPVRPSLMDRKLGMANLVMAYTRYPYVGGPRAIY